MIKEIDGKQIGSGGAGNKILMLLEDKGDVYLQDRGVSRWDTCAGEAILRAKGGLLCKLTEFEKTGNTDSHYIYKKVDVNPDTNDEAEHTTQNSNDDKTVFNPTNNLCGLVAITGEKKNKKILDKTYLQKIYETIQSLPIKESKELKFEYS